VSHRILGTIVCLLTARIACFSLFFYIHMHKLVGRMLPYCCVRPRRDGKAVQGSLSLYILLQLAQPKNYVHKPAIRVDSWLGMPYISHSSRHEGTFVIQMDFGSADKCAESHITITWESLSRRTGCCRYSTAAKAVQLKVTRAEGKTKQAA
jgi:hypothetical protein